MRARFKLRSVTMAIDNRDWYKDWLRKKTGYVERASFRMGEHEIARHKHAKAWRRNWIKLAISVALLTVFLWLKPLILSVL